jgi:hypothetical protein
MTNIFASEVQKQAFKDGVQDENRSAIPMATVSDVDTENLEVMNNRYGTDFVADSTTDGTYSVNDFTMSNDSLTISNQAVYGERIQTKDLVHAGDAWDIVNDRIDRHTRGLGVVVHRDTYSTTVDGAGLILDNEVLAGSASAGTPITMSASNPDEVATKVYSLMQDAGVAASQGRPYFMIDPSTARFFKLFGMGAGFNVADRQLMKGFEILPTFDFDYVITPEIEHEQVLTFTDVNVNTETVTVKGVTFTSATAPSAAGEVDVAATTEEQAATLYAAAINNTNGYAAGAGSASAYFEVSAADRLILKNAGVVATVVGATVVVTAYGSIAGAETETNASWGTEQKNLLAGLRNSTHLALPSKGFFIDEIDQVPGFTGSELRSTQIYDSTVWTKNAPKICKILVAA